MNGSNVLEGRVELCINNAWGTVCTDSISEDDVEVICRQIGQLPPGTLKVYTKYHSSVLFSVAILRLLPRFIVMC